MCVVIAAIAIAAALYVDGMLSIIACAPQPLHVLHKRGWDCSNGGEQSGVRTLSGSAALQSNAGHACANGHVCTHVTDAHARV
jgi:hypothetical protein